MGFIARKSLPSEKIYHSWSAQVGNNHGMGKSEPVHCLQKHKRAPTLRKSHWEAGGHIEHLLWLSKYLANNCIWQNNYIYLIILNNFYATRGSHFFWPTLYNMPIIYRPNNFKLHKHCLHLTLSTGRDALIDNVKAVCAYLVSLV